MTEAIYDWMRNLAFFFLFMTAILNCLPDNQYRKYVQYFLGLLLLLVLLKPLLSVLNLDEIISENLDSATLELELKNSKDSVLSVEGVQESFLNRAYEEELESQIKMMLEGKEIEVRQVTVSLTRGENLAVDRISLEVSNPEEAMYQRDEARIVQDFQNKLDGVKTELSQVYQVDESHIDISR